MLYLLEVAYNLNQMSFSAAFQMFKDSARVVFNDRFMGDDGARELAAFLASHGRVESLEIKSNDISSAGFIEIFKGLERNPGLRQLIVEYNNLGENDYEAWHDALGSLISKSAKLERLNISNNKITGEGFSPLIYPISESKSLKLLEIRYNNINSQQIESLTREIKNSGNNALLFVEMSGNKIKREAIDDLEAVLKNNRKLNPISKDKLLMTGGFHDKLGGENSRSMGSFNKTNAIDDMSKENILKHLEDILDQNRKDTAEMKVRMENELGELVKREKIDSSELNGLEKKCNELIILNRNLKFQLDRTVSEHQQMERDQEYHMRVHEEKLREANKQLQTLESKYEEIESRMNKEHEMKMKEIAREWEARLRSVEDKIRTAENDNNVIENDIRKHLEKRERLRMEYVEEENIVRCRVEEEELQKHNFKISALESRLRELEEGRDKYIRRNQDLVYELDKSESDNQREISELEEELESLKSQEDEFVRKNKDFVTRNQKIKSEIQMKEISIEKLEEEINRFNEEIELKKTYNREQIDKIITDHEYDRSRKEEEKQKQIQKLNDLESALRNSQLQNAKLRQQYAILAQKLQISLGRAVQQVFAENHLY